MNPADAREMERISSDLDALLGVFGGPERVIDLEARRFRAELDRDSEAAEELLDQVRRLGAHHEAALELLKAFGVALERQNVLLAHAAHAGALDLVRRALEDDARREEGDEDEG